MATIGRKASDVAGAAAAFTSPFTRRVAEAIGNVTNNKGGGHKRGRKSSGDNNNDDGNNQRCADSNTPFSFLDTMCGPMMRNFNGGSGESNDADDLQLSERTPRGRSGGDGREMHGRGVGSAGGRRPTGSYDYDDETNVTDMTGSYDDDDDTYDDESRRKSWSEKRTRGRDRKPRGRSPVDSPSEMTGMTGGYSEFDDDTTQNDTVTDTSSAYYNDKHKSSRKEKDHKSKKNDDDDTTTKDSEKLITQPLASGFAKRCYFTKSGIGRSTQHYEGLTLTGNTVLMLAAAMKLKGCPTICDEDLRRVEQTYPNQFSRLPDELLLSSGWRRISKYCHFSHKPLPDGVPFFHSRKRCHPNGGFYFLLCSAVGMTRLMDVEPLNRDALAVLQTDFPMTCDKAPDALCEDPSEWTLVNKFCFFSGGPINVEEDVYYRAELGGTEIYMLAFLSPSLSPEELYRLKPSSGGGGRQQGQQQQEDTGPLKSVAAVEEVESVYDLTERDFDDLKLYHLGPCRALPPYLLHPETWTKVLPPRFVSAREEALRIAQDWESRYPSSASMSMEGSATNQQSVQGDNGGNMTAGGSPGSGYVELGGGGGRPPQSTRSSMPSVGPGGPGYPPQYPGHPGMLTPSMSQMSRQDMHPPYYPPQQSTGGGMDHAGYPQQHHPQQHPQYNAFGPPSPMETELNYYYGASPGTAPQAPVQSPGSFQQHDMPPPSATNPYGNPNMGAPSPERMSASHMGPMGAGGGPYDSGPHQPYGNMPQHMMADPHWRDVQEEGAFGRLGGDQPHDEAIASRGDMYGGMNGVGPGGGGMMHHSMGPADMGHMDMGPNEMGPNEMGPMDMGPTESEDQSQMYHSERHDPPDADTGSHYAYGDDAKSAASGTSSLMGGAQNRLKQNRMKKMQDKRSLRTDLPTKSGGQRPDLSTKLGGRRPDLSTKSGGRRPDLTNKLRGQRPDLSTKSGSQRPDLSTKLERNNKPMTPGAGDDSTCDDRTDGESSYGTSLVSGSSYTDTTNPNERNSRRALILQMAKARMKNVKDISTVGKNPDQGQGGGDADPQDELVDQVAGLELD
mmetsp:Transcript_4223/g.9275  ORF Transcript_4223/g.9275 Transcript_4223/m.9275 type:complete len:1066 (-) Transcript_4223:125-3322(-)